MRQYQEKGRNRLRLGLVVNAFVALSMAWTLAVYANVVSPSELYLECCAKCHGETGHGDGPSADGLAVKPRNFTDCPTMASISDETAFKAIKMGGLSVGLSGGMPSWGEALTDEQIRMLITYVRQFCVAQQK